MKIYKITKVKTKIKILENCEEMKKEVGKRLEYIDVMKGILILLVVCAHAQPGREIHKFIYLFHMPVFFMISGYLWNDQNVVTLSDLGKYLKRKIKSLYLPYVLANGIFWTFDFFIHNLSIKAYFLSLMKVFCFQGRHQLSDTTWYLNVLFFASMIFAIENVAIKKIELQKKRYLVLTSISLLFLSCGCITSYLNINRQLMGTVLTAVFLLHVGRLFQCIQKPENRVLENYGFMGGYFDFGLLLFCF